MADTNIIELQPGDHLKLSRNLKTSEAPGTPNIRTYSDGFDVRVIRGKKDLGIKASFKHGESLMLHGDGHDVVLEIPQTVSAENKDIPHLQINSSGTVNITGGSFILTDKSSGRASVNTPETNLSDATLTSEPTKDTPADKTPLTLVLPLDGKMNRQSVIMERGNTRLDIVDAKSKKVLVTLAGNDTLDANKEALKAKQKPKDGPAKEDNTPDKPLKRRLNGEEIEDINKLSAGIVSAIDATKTDFADFYKKHGDIAKQVDEVKKRAGELLEGNTVRNVKEFRAALDAAIKGSETAAKGARGEDGLNANLLKEELNKIKEDVDKRDVLKISMTPQDMPDHALAAAKKAAGALTKNEYTLAAVMDYGSGGDKGQNNKTAPSTETVTSTTPGRFA